MKIIINENHIGALIQEINRTDKKCKGGCFHRVFESKSNPNIVYKVGQTIDVDRWISVFINYPEFFPRVYKRGKVTDKRILVNFFYSDVSYVVVEKLDTERAEFDWDLIEEFVKKWAYYNLELSNINFDRLMGNPTRFLDVIEHIIYEMEKKQPELIDLFMKFYTLILDIYEIFPSADIHRNQFGYDKQGNLKCLDI